MEMTQKAEEEAQRWREEAIFDPLTRVFNRRFLEQKLREYFMQAAKDDIRFGLLFIDLDGFKPLNDRFGHAFGDVVLQKIATCLQKAVRPGDIVARFGGDEFCILSEPLDDLGVQALGHRVWETIRTLTIQHGPDTGKVGASIGAVCRGPLSNWPTPEAFLSGADKAMYLAKSRGRDRVVFLRSMTEASETPTSAEVSARTLTPETEYSV
jgi:diguanylate cyclase (GGDEF)-like protein